CTAYYSNYEGLWYFDYW
nr:immunoglobulin heavy chain junction region [Mus musculus]